MTREEAVQELKYIYDSLVSCDLSYEALDMAIKSLSADVQPVVRGEWIHEESQPDLWECSKCHWLIDGAYICPTNYCPNCGAKMVEE